MELLITGTVSNTNDNAISANNDGDNDFLYIEDVTDECYINKKVEIFNR